MTIEQPSPKIEQWPTVFSEVLEVGNPESNVAICTLWTHRQSVARWFTPDEYALIGNLYSYEGISPMVRNVLANPHIRYIVLWGNDLSASGDALVEFMRDGLNDKYRTASGTAQLEREIDLDAINLLRERVQLIDIRSADLETLKATVKGLPQQEAFAEPRIFPIAEDDPDEADGEYRASEETGFRVSDATIAATWLHVVYAVMSYGKGKYTKYGNKNELKEILNLTAVITDEAPHDEFLPDYLPVTRERLDQYYPQVMTATPVDGADYSYGMRLRDHESFGEAYDQIQIMTERLMKKPSSKRMFASTWQVAHDAIDGGGDAPCLTQILGSVQDNKFYLTAHFRSQDMFGAWPLNAFSMRKLQAKMAEAAEVELGPLTVITHSAHIYAWDWERARDVMGEYLKHRKPAAEVDKRGYVVITTNADAIEAKLYARQTNQVLDKVKGNNARKLGLEVIRRMWTADAGHALYLGRELMKAEIALQTGQTFIQDHSLEIPEIGIKLR